MTAAVCRFRSGLPELGRAGTIAALLATAVFGAEIRVVGSDLLGVEFSKSLYDFAGRNELSLALAFDGSRPGLDQLRTNRADLAVLALPAEEERTVAGFASLTVGYHVVVVLVPASLPLERVTLAELGGIFGEGGPASVNRWADLGVGGERAVSAIEPHMPEVGRGMAVEFFRHVVLRDRAFKSSVARFASLAELRLHLGPESRAIAVAPARLGGAAVKVVPVAVSAGGPAYSPTPENVHAGDYPLRLPVRVVFRRESLAALRPLLRHFFHDELAAQFERAEVLPLPVSARRQQTLALEKL